MDGPQVHLERSESEAQSRKAGVSFEAATQFFDPHAIVRDDSEDEHGEMRYHALGYGANPQLLLTVTFVDRSTDEQEVLHIISARKADDYEQRAYSDQF